MPGHFLAEFEMYVMLAVAQLGDDAYGLAVRKCIETRTGRPVSVGALYTTLARLESKGFVTMSDPDSSSGRRGRPRRYCALTPEGQYATRHSLSMLERMADGVPLDGALEARREGCGRWEDERALQLRRLLPDPLQHLDQHPGQRRPE